MILSVIGAVLLFLVLVLSLLRFTRMATFVAWFISAVTRTRDQSKTSELVNNSPDGEELSTEDNIRTKNKKPRQKIKKVNDEPIFDTDLSTSIEHVIEETITEEEKSAPSQHTPKKSKKPRSQLKRQKSEDSDKSNKTQIRKESEENTSVSLSKQKSPGSSNEGVLKKTLITEKKDELVGNVEEDDIGFSFLPVKEKIRRNKNKNLSEKETSTDTSSSFLVEQSIRKIKDLSEPSIIDHYSKRGIKEKIANTTEPINTKLQLQSQSPEQKRSKLVSPNISYANILTYNEKNINTIEVDSENRIYKNEECQFVNYDKNVTKLNISTSESNTISINKANTTEITSDIDCPPNLYFTVVEDYIQLYKGEKPTVEAIKEVVGNFKVTESFENNTQTISKSNSSSIELITEINEETYLEPNNSESAVKSESEFEDLKIERVPIHVTEENIQVEGSDSSINQLDEIREKASFSYSGSSSISIVDHQTECEDTLAIVGGNNTSSKDDSTQNYLQTHDITETLVEVSDKLNLLVEKSQETPAKFEQSNKDISLDNHYITSDQTSSYVENFFTIEDGTCDLSKKIDPNQLKEQNLLHNETDTVNSELLQELLSETTVENYLPSQAENPNSLLESYPSHNDEQLVDDSHVSEGEIVSIIKAEKAPENTILLEPVEQEIFNNNTINPVNHITLQQEANKTNTTQGEPRNIQEKSTAVQEESLIEESYPLNGSSTNLVETDHIEVTIGEGSLKELNMSVAQQIRVLTLNNQEHQEGTLYRIQKDWIIQFRLGPSLFGRKVYLYCNYPTESNGKLSGFNRNQYQLLNWAFDEGCKNADDTAAFTQIKVKLAGSFHYYITYENGENAEKQGSGFFLVDPILKYGNNENLSLDCIQCQTVLAKSLGSFSSWERKLQVAKEAGYNMIHFTPIQELGASNSGYSISEQLNVNPAFKKENGEMPQFQEIEQFMEKIRTEWEVTSICDIVLNHTANESKWIKEHPEVTYNCINCPYMRPAYLLDAAFYQFSMDIKRGFYEDKGIPIDISNEDHLNAIRYHFHTNVLEPLRLQELYICDVNNLIGEFLSTARVTTPVTHDFRKKMQELELIQDPEYKRLSGTVDIKLAQKIYNVYWNDTFDEESRLKRCAEEFKNKLDSLNNAVTEKLNAHLSAAIENVIAGIRYFRVQPDGPKLRDINIKYPLVYRYFTDYGSPKSLKEHEDIMYSSNGRFLMAHNGWVMNSDPLKNFAASDSNVYIRRELIAWGDSVKLRYGNKPEECPFLWQYMRKYIEQIAKIFDGVRLDNCHSTPIPVAEYLLDCARKIKPDLYIVAELFTNSDLTDNIFVNRLGIASLVREAMSAWDSHEEGRLVYRYGGYPVGSFYQPSIRPLVPSIAHALFLDLTHDNPSPVEKRSVFDLLPSTALVNMACCASGSNRGYDELVPHHIHVVDESRQYTEWTDDENLAMGYPRYASKKSGIIVAKKAINDLHFTLGKEGFNQVYVDQMDPDIVAVTRHCPETHQSYILVAFTAFQHPNEDAERHQRNIKPLRVEGVLEEIVLEATLSHINNKTGGSKFAKWETFAKDSNWINGLSEYQVSLNQHITVNESEILEKVDSGTPNVTQLNFKNFKPGSVVVIKVSLPEVMRESVQTLRRLIGSITKDKELIDVINKLKLSDLNRILYRCDQEEKDEGFGFGTYNIPNFASTVYAGLQGFISLLANIRPNNDLGHPMCGNLRDGNWMIEFIWKRLKLDEGTQDLGLWIEENTKCFNTIPRYLVPCYFDAIFTGLYILLVEQCYKLMSTFVSHGSTFVRGLSIGSVQFAAYIKSADLPILSPNLAPPKPPTRKNEKGDVIQACVSLSAGLPHFSVGYMRNWGRDTFIALRGLFILTGRFEEARQHILGYGACLRHGLIPNLLDGGRNPRFNCRDAVWWWLYCIKEYTEESPNGLSILNDKVSRIFPIDDSPAQPPGTVDQPLYEVIQEALTVHFQGLAFRERNAGHQIDAHMTDRGFNNRIGIHPETGFVFGGNEWNCGTWMDKMGSSDKAGNRGKPATPRDGSAVELVGLSKAVISWLSRLSEEEKYPFSCVERTHKNGSITKWSFKEWNDKIQTNFEKYFWINTFPVPNEIKPNLINKRGIYKDCYGATQDWTDFQLRCNFPIAMVVAPELFTPQQAWIALNQVEKHLLGPLGLKTLDPDDWIYRGDYDNSNDSEDPSVAHGFNYHQGPEWVWPIGFFLRAKLHFARENGALKETVASTKLILSQHFLELQTSPWRGLPELTNSNGSYCKDSSRTQAWSMSCILEVLSDLQKIESSQMVIN